MKEKYDIILETLIQSIERRDGANRVSELRKEIGEATMEGMKREMILQIIAREPAKVRKRFLLLYPELRKMYKDRIQ